MPRPHEHTGTPLRGWRRPWIAAATVLAALLPVVAVMTAAVARSQREVSEARFQQAAYQARVGVSAEVSSYLGKLRDEGAFLSTERDASPEEFAAYLAATGVFQKMPFMEAVLYVERVPSEELPAFIERRRRVDPSFQYTYLGSDDPGPERFIVSQFIIDGTPSRVGLGFDAASIPIVAQLVAASARTGSGVAAAIQDDPAVAHYDSQVQENSSLYRAINADFYVGVPVYAPTPDGSRGGFRGVVVAPIVDFDALFAKITHGQPEELGFSLSMDLTHLGVYDRADLQRGGSREGAAGPVADAAFRDDRPLEVDGVSFRLTTWSGPDADTSTASGVWAAVTGLLVAGLIALLVFLRTRVSAAVAERARQQQAIIDSVTDALVVVDRAALITAANPAGQRLVDPDADGGPVIGRSYLDSVTPHLLQGADQLDAALRAAIAGAIGSHHVDIAKRGPGERRWYGVRITPVDGPKTGAVVVHTDITDHKDAHEDSEYRATHDPLTGLPNRAALEATLDDLLDPRHAAPAGTTVLFVDLDGFKQINDRLGHDSGDEVLRTIASRLRNAVRDRDMLARFGGDEFVVVIGGERAGEAVAQRILDALEAPVSSLGTHLTIGASIGIATAEPGETRKQVLHRADHAMYLAKESGRGRWMRAAPRSLVRDELGTLTTPSGS